MLKIEVTTIRTRGYVADAQAKVQFKANENSDMDVTVQRCVQIEAALRALEDAFPQELTAAVAHICHGGDK